MKKNYLSQGCNGGLFWACYRSNKMNSPLVGVGANKTDALNELHSKISEFKQAGRKL